MPIALLRVTLSGGQVHGWETGQQETHTDPQTMCFFHLGNHLNARSVI